MKAYLLDTNIISETAPGRAIRDSEVVRWLEDHTDRLFLSVVTIAEIESGIALAVRREARQKARKLSAWLDAIIGLYGDRVLPMETSVARIAGRLSGDARASGLAPGFADIAIAGTALHHKLTILSRNIRHFAPLGVSAIDLFFHRPA